EGRIAAATNRTRRAGEPSRPAPYPRLATIEIRVPPLRDRRGDIPILARRFLAEHGRGDVALDDELLERLAARTWSGNVRELRNAIHRYAVLGPSALDELPAYEPAAAAASAAEPRAAPTSIDDLVRQAFAQHAPIRLAARPIRMAKSTFHEKARKLGLRKRRG